MTPMGMATTLLGHVPERLRRPLRDCAYHLASKLAPLHPRVEAWREECRLRPPSLDQKTARYLAERAESSRGTRGDVVILPAIDWRYRTQRPQHMARELAHLGWRVFYVSPMMTRGPAICRVTAQWHQRVFELRASAPSLPPPPNQWRADPAWADEVGKAMAEALARLGAEHPTLLIQWPAWLPVIESLPTIGRVIYDRIDAHAAFPHHWPGIDSLETRLMARAHAVTVTANCLMPAPPATATLIRNGVEWEHFSTVAGRTAGGDGFPTVCYMGAIAEWFDFDLVAQAAKALPDWTFLLVGGTMGADFAPIRGLSNVILRGEMPYHQLPQMLSTADIAVIPFTLTELTTATDPVKLYEYLAAGLPVVSTRLPELVACGAPVRFADDATDFVQQLQLSWGDALDSRTASTLSQWAARHSWAMRAAAMDGVLCGSTPSAEEKES